VVVLNDGTRITIQPPRPPAVFEVTGPWQVRFAPGLGAPAGAVEFEKLVSWPEHKDAGIRHFSGAATYRTTFTLPEITPGASRTTWLDLGEVAVIAEVKLNGRDLGILWKPPFRVPVDGVGKSGANDLAVRVVNLWPNRMIGDAALPEDDIEWQTGGRRGQYPAKWPDWLIQGRPRPSGRISFCTRKDVYAKDAPLLTSGLLGPVTLRTVEKITVK
jgi:hypothetical protein